MTLLLSDAEIADMRATVNRTLPDSATIEHDTQVSDSAGGYTVTTATTGPFACRVATASGSEEVIAGRLDAVGSWTITLPALTEVAATDRIVIGSRRFEVILPLRPRSWELSRRVACQEIT